MGYRVIWLLRNPREWESMELDDVGVDASALGVIRFDVLPTL